MEEGSDGLNRWIDRELRVDRQMDMAFPKGSFPLHHPIIQPSASLMDVPKSIWPVLPLGGLGAAGPQAHLSRSSQSSPPQRSRNSSVFIPPTRSKSDL